MSTPDFVFAAFIVVLAFIASCKWAMVFYSLTLDARDRAECERRRDDERMKK